MEGRGGTVEVALGDARLSLEHEAPQRFDTLLLDAFSGDSVPVHLLTKDAFEIYKRHMSPDGIIAVHVSNRYLALAPVIVKVAEAVGMKTTRVLTDLDGFDESTDYVLVTNNEAFLSAHPPEEPADAEPEAQSVWTDTKYNLFEALMTESTWVDRWIKPWWPWVKTIVAAAAVLALLAAVVVVISGRRFFPGKAASTPPPLTPDAG
jgi:spermidine synthase